MSPGQSLAKPEYLARAQRQLDEARAAGDRRAESLAQAEVGHALFLRRKYADGMATLDQAIALATEIGEWQLLAQVLGRKTLTLQDIGRLPDAFETAREIQALAEQHDDDALKSDALASQGQILLDSGEPTLAVDKLVAARNIAQALDDQRRLLNVYGALGHVSLALAAADRAELYFDRALGLARQLGNRAAECGHLGNRGTVLAWQGLTRPAVEAFEQALALARECQDQQAEVNALFHLARLSDRLGEYARSLELAQMGITLAGAAEPDMVPGFLDLAIRAHYQLHEVEAAHEAVQQAIRLARARRDRQKEVDLLLNLGESHLVAGQNEAALDTYRLALEGATALERHKDEAYLTGRVGTALAELGRTVEAVPFHQQALALARLRGLPELEGEQLSLLAMDHRDQGDLRQARHCCAQAIQVFSDAQLTTEADRARQLLAELKDSPLAASGA